MNNLIGKNLTAGYGGVDIIKDINLEVNEGEIVVIVGPNGAGKSTLFKLIIGVEKPSNGEILLGETVKLSYVDQSRDHLNNSNTVWEEISEGQEIVKLGELEVNSRAYCGSFNFKGSDQKLRKRSRSCRGRPRLVCRRWYRSGLWP